MNIYKILQEKIIAALQQMIVDRVLPENISFDNVTVEPPRDPKHGDIATNAAMVIAKPSGKKPRDIAEILSGKLAELSIVSSVEIAGPGFINLKLKNSFLHEVIIAALSDKNNFGKSDIGGGEKVNIEYVSANPTGPMHIGHARGAVVGDVMARLMEKAGFNITKEYYINDAGGQVDLLAHSAYLRYREALGEEVVAIPEGLYPGEYLKVVGIDFAALHKSKYLGVAEEKWLPVLREFALDKMMNLIKNDLLKLGIKHDVFTSEKKLIENDAVEKCLRLLTKKELVYEGILEPPKGKKLEDWEAREQTLFRSTNFGDDVDRPLRKSDGSGTYFASDIAYHHDKLNRGFNHMILVLGADHGGYVKRMKAAVSALSDATANLDILLYQLVHFLEDGEPMKMSKRSGSYITVHDVVEAVGRDVVRFIMLTRKAEAILDFDMKKVTEQSKDNPVFYVQYGHARCHSVLRNAAEKIPEITESLEENISLEGLVALTHESELSLIKLIAQWPRAVESAAVNLEPHRIAFYLQELAAGFHTLWNMGNEDTSLRFIIEDNSDLTKARLLLVKTVALTLSSGLSVMGIKPVNSM